MKLLKSLGWLTLAEGIGRLGAVLAVLYLARTLGSEGLGRFGAAFSIVSFVGLFASGAGAYKGIRELMRPRVDVAEVARLNTAAQVLLWCAAVSLLGLVVLLFAVPLQEQALVAIYLLLPLVQATGVGWVLRARNVLPPLVVAEALFNVLYLGLLLLLIRPATPLPMVAALHVLATLAQVGYVRWQARRLGVRWAGPLAPAPLLRATLQTAKISLGRLPRLVFMQGDVLMLALWSSAAAAGQFLASQRIVLTVLVLGNLMRATVFPRVAALAPRRPRVALRLQWRTLGREWLLVLPLCGLLWWMAAPLVELLFGPGYGQAAQVLQCMLWAVPAVSLALMLQDHLAAGHHDGHYLLVNAATMVLHVALASVWMPGGGALGAARASLLAQSLGALALLGLVLAQRLRCGPGQLQQHEHGRARP